jgi:Ca2+-binding RTX toxin-like protein
VSIIPALPTKPTVTPIIDVIKVTTNTNQPYTVAAGGTIYATSLQTLLETWGAGYISPLTNNGTMWNEVSSGSGWASITTDAFNIVNSGLMVLHVGPGTAVDADAIADADQNASLNNSGQIYVINEGAGRAAAVYSYVGGAFVNNGLVAVHALNGTGYGYFTNNESSLDNRAGAQLLVEGMGAIAFGTYNGGSSSAPTMITNAGTIQAVSLDPEQLSFGLYLGGYGIGSAANYFNVTNSGLISADVAIYGADDAATTMGAVVQLVHNLTGGTINGLIYLQRGDDLVENAGTINGDLYMGEGADTVDTRAGVIDGVSDLGWGNDVYKGGSAADFVAGARDNDALDGGAGNDQLMGGGGKDVLVGGSGNDGLFGEWDDDRIVTSGGDYADGGDGNDRIELGDYTFEYVTGGAGFDTLVLPGGTRTLNLHSVLAENALTDFEQIELGGNKTLVIEAADVTALTGGETSLRLVTMATDHVNLVGTWTHAADQVIGGVNWHSYVSGDVSILVEGSAVVTSGAASSGSGLDPFAGGDLAPIPGEGIDFTSAVEVLDRYELTGDITIQSYETMRAGTTGVVFSDWVGTSLTNYGTIESVGWYASTLEVNNSEKILNYGTIRADSSGSGYSARAIWTDSFTDVENHGLITALATVGDADGVYTADLHNYGTIEASTTTGFALGVSTWNGDLDNQGIITASSGGIYAGSLGAAATGVDIYNGSGTNSGTIIATAGSGIAKAMSVFVYGSETLTNTGAITAVSNAPDALADVPDEIAISADAYNPGTILNLINSGQITGALMLTGQGTFNIQNASLIDGMIWLGAFEDYSTAAVQVTNSGHITGELRFDVGQSTISIQNSGQLDGIIKLGSGNDLFDGHLGVQSGSISGGAGNDNIIGGAGAEQMSGGAGDDTLTGGAGRDLFVDTAARLSGDTITDFSAGDKIVISDANLAAFSFSLSGNTLTFTGGSLTLSSVPSGTIVANAAAGGGVQLIVAQHDPANDFNGDGRSDILWRDDGGVITDWLGQANGGFAANWGNSFKTVTTDWHVAGTGDFNGDGRDDILWRNDNGLTVDWLGQANGGFASNYANSAINVPTSWAIAGIGDFNGDGKEDILWRDTASGLTVDWLGQANGSFASNWANSVVTVPTDWKVAGIGDFNGDGLSDILWRNSAGLTVDWLGQASGGFTNNWNNSAANVPTEWKVAGTGDFNGDGHDDILWRSDSGWVTEWLGQANGGFTNNWANMAAGVPTDWHVASIGDFNGDGKDDVLWRSDSGQTTDWLGSSSGGFSDNYSNAASFVPTSWHVQAEAFL